MYLFQKMKETTKADRKAIENYSSFNEVTEKYNFESQGIENDLSKISLCSLKERNSRDIPSVFNLTKEEQTDYRKRAQLFFAHIDVDQNFLSDKDKQFLLEREKHLNKIYYYFFFSILSSQIALLGLFKRIGYEKRTIYFRSFMFFSFSFITISHHLSKLGRSIVSDKTYSEKIYTLVNRYV